MRGLWAQLRLELALTFRNAESLLLTLGIPVVILVFFSVVDVLPIDGDDVDFLAPGTLALAVLATAFANLAIATGFERSYGVLKRLGTTPLGRPRLVAAKALAVLVVIVVQVAVLAAAALALGWRPDVDALPLVAALVLAVVAFTRLGPGARRSGTGAGGTRRRQRHLRRPAAPVGDGVPARRAAGDAARDRPGAAVHRARRGGPRRRSPTGWGSRGGCGRSSSSGRRVPSGWR